jgi:hypothetical protein
VIGRNFRQRNLLQEDVVNGSVLLDHDRSHGVLLCYSNGRVKSWRRILRCHRTACPHTSRSFPSIVLEDLKAGSS